MQGNFVMAQPFTDAQAALPFVVEQGRNLETRIYQTRYTTLDYARHVPVVTEGNPWAVGTQFYVDDFTGEAKIISGSANDLPLTQVTREQKTHDFFMVGAGWDWTLEQVNQAAMYGNPLNARKAMGATQNTERLLHNIAMSGSTEVNIKGLVNDTSITATDVANDGTGSSRYWSAKTPTLILRDVNDLLGSVRENSEEIEWADTLRLPPEAFRDIATRRLGDGDADMTILAYLQRNNVYTAETGQALDIAPLRELATAAASSQGRMIVYRRSEEVMKFHLPMPRTVLPVHQASLMKFEQGVVARTGGLEIRLPKACAYGDLITAAPS